MYYIGEIQYDTSLLHYEGNIIIFGAGLWGELAYQYLSKYNPLAKIVCYLDNNQSLWNSFKSDICILSPSEAIIRFPEARYVIASKYAREISLQLIALNISDEYIHLLRF